MTERLTPDEYVERLLALAARLERGEALAIPVVHVWLARSRSRLRIGFGWMGVGWPRGEVEDLLRDHLTGVLNWRNTGSSASDYRRELDRFLAKPEAFRVQAIGRDNPLIVRDSGRSLA